MKDTVFKANEVRQKMLKFCGSFEQTNVEYQHISTNPENKLSVSVVAGDQDWYRARVPYKHLGDKNCSVNICCYTRSKKVFILNESKFIIASKIVDDVIFSLIKEIAKKNNSLVIFDTDDNYHNGDKENPNYHFFDNETERGKKNIEILERNIASSDYVFYSTRELLAHYKHLNPNCTFFPNYLDIEERYIFQDKFDWKNHAKQQGCNVDENSILIGFFGSSSHIVDLNEIMEPIIQILREYDNVFLGLLCEFDMAMNVCMRNHKVPTNKLVYFDCLSYVDYPYKLTSFDIGLAPVRNSIFGRCKSPLKLMEYGALSIPYVASKVANNQRFHLESKGIGGLIAQDKNDWYLHLKKLIEDKELRLKLGNSLKDFVYQNYDVKHSLMPLVETFDTIYHNKDRKFNHPTPYDLADCYDGLPEVKTEYTEHDFCPCGSGDLYTKCHNNCYPAWGFIINKTIDYHPV